ncbi:MAG TPA: carboxylate--amine ligase [Candidatus Faecousia intestinigallinarum]|nr:carboxylate--amine ligase [Candidatus Faecousia intestinigallinarum]
MDLKYLTRVLKGMRLEKLQRCIDIVHQRSGKAKAAIFLDMAGCAARYGAGYYDYMIFAFYDMTAKERATYMTRMKNKKLMGMMNDPAYTHLFSHKNEFYHLFREFLGRAFLDLSQCSQEELADFLRSRDTVIAKPSVGECGKGIEKVRLSQFDTVEDACKYLMDPANRFGVVEDVIVQHEKMNQLYPYSVNCFRMVTLVHQGVPHVLYAVLKTGNNGNFVDNLENGGFACHFDLEKGEISGPAHTATTAIAEVHPATGVRFQGFQVPFVREAMEMVKKAALVVPQVRYIGWDVCITPTGPAIVEGNNYAAYDFPQLPDEGREHVGLLKQIRDIGVKI